MKKNFILLLVSIMLAGTAYSQPKPIAPKAAKEMIMSGKDIVLLDVRTREEFASGRIPGSILLPYDQIDASSAALIIGSKDRTVIVYCRTGRRSAIAASTLASLGYGKVFDLGGIGSWPYEIVRGEPGKL